MEDKKLNYLAKNGDILEITKLADEYFDKKDYNNAALYFYKLSELNDEYGYYSLGYCYKNGYGVERNYEEAVYWYKKAAEKKEVFSMIELGKMYYRGLGVEQNYDEAYKNYYAAAVTGNYEALYLASKIVLDGLTKCGSPDVAVDMMSAAANDDYIDAIRYLGLMYYDDLNFYITSDKQRGLFYLKKGVELNDPLCMCKLGEIYIYDYHYEAEKGIELIEKSAELNYDTAYLILGDLYSNYNIKNTKDFKIIKDMNKALNYYELAYKEGNVLACKRLACYYFKNKDYNKYKDYIIEGHESDEAFCSYNYALFLMFGILGLANNKDRALEILYEVSTLDYEPAERLYDKINKKGIACIKDKHKKKLFKEILKNINF